MPLPALVGSCRGPLLIISLTQFPVPHTYFIIRKKPLNKLAVPFSDSLLITGMRMTMKVMVMLIMELVTVTEILSTDDAPSLLSIHYLM